ncbi:hypothetical protein CPC08DRAFT_131168 [Agrocybe pediades]|nr:hypothetical protein CPC08DRAFT_131168 [Agrocybe pediades]
MQQVRRQKMWAFLKEPAAQLRGLKISIPELQHQVLHSCLFADDAPQLRRFDVLSTPYKFPTNASWVANLTSVTFTETFIREEVLMALQGMPRLVF